MKSDCAKKIRKVGALDRSEMRNCDGSATKEAGEGITNRVEHGTRLELRTRQLRPFDNTVPLQSPAGHEKANMVVQDVNKQWTQIAY